MHLFTFNFLKFQLSLRNCLRFSALAATILTGWLMLFCSNATLESDDVYLIRVNGQTLTVGEYNQAFEISKSAYPYNLSQDSTLLKEAQAGMLNQLVEELLVLQRATELGIELTDAEAHQAIAKIKADYPEGVFEQMLLEHAVSYSFWEKRLKARLKMEKVIDRDVRQNISLSSEEIAKYYKENYEVSPSVTGQNPDKGQIDEMIVKQLRRQKSEEAYQLWIKDLKAKYVIDINQAQWKRLTGL